jgi:hypothetical protein
VAGGADLGVEVARRPKVHAAVAGGAVARRHVDMVRGVFGARVILVLKRPGKPLPGFSHGQSVEIRKTVNLLLSQAGTGTWGNFPSC